jgi:hypothetical protein
VIETSPGASASRQTIYRTARTEGWDGIVALPADAEGPESSTDFGVGGNIGCDWRRPKEAGMRLPDHIFSIVKALHAKNLALAHGDENDRRKLQKKIVETAVARHPSEGWGWKKSGTTNPPSKDAIANNKLGLPHLICWDCFNGATREPVQGDAIEIDGQVFIEVAGHDHLGDDVDVDVDDDSGDQAQPSSTALPSREEFLEALVWLDGVYREQLGRSRVDLEGIAAHIFGVFLPARLAGDSVVDAKKKVVKQINDILGRTDIHV